MLKTSKHIFEEIEILPRVVPLYWGYSLAHTTKGICPSLPRLSGYTLNIAGVLTVLTLVKKQDIPVIPLPRGYCAFFFPEADSYRKYRGLPFKSRTVCLVQ